MSIFKKISFLFFFISIKCLAQNPTPNIGFEDGNFNNWRCYIGTIDINGIINVNAVTQPVYDRQTIIGKESAKILDPYGLFPVLCPNGSNYSIRLGNSGTGAEAERVTYTFKVPNLPSYSIIFNYAVVLQNPYHLPYQQPQFTAQVYDVDDDKYIECPSFDFVAGSALPGFKLSTVKSFQATQNVSVYYKDWSTATVDLHNYAGKTMRIEFTTNDCTKGGHFGYAYLDVEDNSTYSPITGNNYCLGQKSVTLYGPNGFSDYYWYNADLTKPIGHGQSIKISPPPPDQTMYALQIYPYPGLGCVDTVYTTINKINDGFNLKVQDTVRGCPGTGADLTAAAVTTGSSPMTFTYFTDSLATSYLYNPNVVTTDGVYYIQGISADGCQAVVPVQVVLGLPPIKIIEPAAVDFPARVDLSKSFIHLKGLTYTYYSDTAATIPVVNYTAIKYSGTFYIKAVNIYGCTIIASVNIIVHPPPKYSITAPNVFTPNNDGINDHFSITINGIVTFESLSVFNRYGQQMFISKSLSTYWDGTVKGKNLPSGTYYWVFEGEDDYNNVKIRKAGSITLLR
jgi:gliding motility-associated-like protein